MLRTEKKRKEGNEQTEVAKEFPYLLPPGGEGRAGDKVQQN